MAEISGSRAAPPGGKNSSESMLIFGKAAYKADHQINSDLLCRTGSMRGLASPLSP